MLKTIFSFFALLFFMGTAYQAKAQNFSLWLRDSVDCQTGIAAVEVWAWGNNPPYTYLWNDGSTTQRIDNPNVGQFYSVTVTDATGATATDNVTARFTSFVPVTVTHTVIQNVCSANGLGGIVDVTVSGGTPPYTYQWGYSGFTTEDVSGLFDSDYIYVGHAGNYCQTYESINVGQGLFNYGTRVNEANCTMATGSINFYTSGNYIYEWSDGQTTASATGLVAGAYGLTVTDPNTNCTVRRVFQVDNTPNCLSTISGYVYNNASCQPTQNGYAWYQQVVITDLTTGQAHYPYTQANGYYQFNTTEATTYSLSVTPYGAVAVICPNTNNYTVTTTAQGGNYSNNNFFIGRANDIDVQVSYYAGNVRPMNNQWNSIYVCNAGNLPQTGDITVVLDPLLTYVPASAYVQSLVNYGYYYNYQPITPTINANNLVFAYSNLLSGECRYISFQANLGSNQPFGTTLSNNVSVTPLVGDAVPADNNDVTVATVVNSYDPNDKQQFNFRSGNSFDAEIYTQDTEMDYLIRFQNTGNAPAIRVEIRDTFENNLIASSVKNINTSHRANVRVEGNVLIATFDNIYLADSFSNEPASHGFISFKMDRQAGLPLQTEINNSAAIYFDFNEPVITNTQVTTIVQPVAIAQTRAEEIGLEIMPNPATTLLNVKYQLVSDVEVSLNIVNGMGQVIKNISQNQNQAAGAQVAQIAVEELPTGVYYLFITTSEGSYAKKFVKQ